MDTKIASIVDANMCTEICPCWKGFDNANLYLYVDMTEEVMNGFGRTLLDEDVMEEDSGDGEPEVLYSRLVWSDDRADEYANFLSYISLFECA